MRALYYILSVFMVMCLSVFSEASGRAVSTSSSEKTGYVFHLPFHTNCFPTYVFVNLAGKEVDFRKVPDWGNSKIVTGALPSGRRSKDFLCFAWDIDNHTLYLDLNRNLDLTDDLAGVYQSIEGTGSKYQRFSNISFETAHIPVQFPHTPVRIPYNIDITFRKTRSKANCTVTVRSGWQGDIELDGKKMRLTVKDNLDGIIKTGDRLFMVPCDYNEQYSAEPTIYNRFIVPRSLSFGEHEYKLAYDFGHDEEKSRLKVTFTDSPHPAGKLRINGRNIKRLILKESSVKGSSMVILDSPASEVQIPAGTYNYQIVILDGGNPFGIFYSTFTNKLTVSDKETAILQTGTPLANTVRVNRSGPILHLDYILSGSGGEKYLRLISRDNYLANEETQPVFSIYCNGENIVSGSFRYG